MLVGLCVSVGVGVGGLEFAGEFLEERVSIGFAEILLQKALLPINSLLHSVHVLPMLLL